MQLQKASRKKASIKMSLQGPSGSGKTYSSLFIAYGLCNYWTKIAVIDTENHSSELYSHLGSYNVLQLSAPYTPEKYVQAIEACGQAGMQVIIIDSISHEWEYILETHAGMTGNSFTNWQKIGIRHKAFIQVQVPQYTWFSVGVVKTKDSVYLYYNGVIVDRAPAKIPIPVNNLPLIVGKRAGVDYDYFVGGIDQLSLWNRSLKQDEVKFFTNCSNGTNQGCVGFYNFDPSENDQSIYKNNATFYSSSSGGFLGLYGLNPFTICSGSRSVSDSIYIKIEPLPTGKIAFSFDGRCLDIPIQFKNSSDSSKTVPLQWKWEMGDGSIYNQSSVLHTYKKTGTFNVKLSMFSPYCTKFKDSLVKQIIVSPPTKPERYKSLNARKDTELPVQARNFGSAYKWRPGNLVVDSLSKNTRAKINKETDFKIYITDSAGCSTVDSQLVRVFDKYSVFVPKAFSPDGNGVNDLLRPILVGIKEVRSFRIYSRWGNLLYQTKDVSIGWDGTYNGQLMPTDTYTWVFEGIDLDNMPVILSGKTTLIR